MRWKTPFLTAYFLVLLRLAIGWHFFYEGYHKVHSLQVGPVQRDGRTVLPFSSAGYFSEGRGPLGEVMRHAIGDPDEQLLERLDGGPTQSTVPVALARDWDLYLQQFSRYYNLDEKQHAEALERLRKAEANFVKWLAAESKTVVKTYPSGTVDVTETNARRVEDYREALRQLRDVYARELPAFGKDVEKARLLKTKADLTQLRKSLQADVDEKTDLLKNSLAELLTGEQKKLGAVPVPEEKTFLNYLDTGTAWFLFIVGGTLLLGLFTRTSCVLAAGFLLLTYLNSPALPWLPTPPNQEGSYFFVSKNVIEMLALLVLATAPSGRWFGVDGILHPIGRSMFGRRRRPEPVGDRN
jgi:uncharacterized membrane protein YphA (DoxX/SURF4 family)